MPWREFCSGCTPLHHEQVSVHFVHVADWEDYAHIAAFSDSPAQWTVYCVQFLGHARFTLTPLHGIVTCV